jgi:hypothetical protein
MGLVPTFPTTVDRYTSVIPVWLRIVKEPAEPRLTGAGPLPALATPVKPMPRSAVRKTLFEPNIITMCPLLEDLKI